MKKTEKIKLPFGLNEHNILVHIADVESGKKCNCICPACRDPLIAAKGAKNQHHFKHATTNECERGLESAIHMTAKQMIMERQEIKLPGYTITKSVKDSKGFMLSTQPKTIVKNGELISFDSVQKERDLYEMRADILAIKRNQMLIIEIFYSHKVDAQKIEKIMRANISAIEINLSDLRPDDVKDMESFWLSINDPNRSKWLHNVKEHADHPDLEKELNEILHKQEQKYKQEDIIKAKQEQKENAQLILSMKELRMLRSEQNIVLQREEKHNQEDKDKQEQEEKAQLIFAQEKLLRLQSKEHIEQLNKDAKMHPVWKNNSKTLQFSLDELPEYLNLDVPNGDWIFGCDRRVWQSAIYIYFVKSGKTRFSTDEVENWLIDKFKSEVPRLVEIIGKYGWKYPKRNSKNIPSSSITLWAYFNYLCKLYLLEFYGEGRLNQVSYLFGRVSKKTEGRLLKLKLY